jgi:WD40 repeat protein
VSRDRSMKLIEVATERLEDNITSITPGALKGGLQAIDRHPTKDDLLTGGADGIPKLYQMFRTKARKIGDDFNLIRAYDPLPGRIFAVRFNGDGTLFAVGSSNSGSGEARVYRTEQAKGHVKLECIRTPIYGIAFSPDGNEVASAGFDGIVYMNDSNSGILRRQFWAAPLAK